VVKTVDHFSDFKNFALAKHNFYANNLMSKQVDDEEEDEYMEDDNDKNVPDELTEPNHCLVPFNENNE
jgi:hypothetical protein